MIDREVDSTTYREDGKTSEKSKKLHFEILYLLQVKEITMNAHPRMQIAIEKNIY